MGCTLKAYVFNAENQTGIFVGPSLLLGTALISCEMAIATTIIGGIDAEKIP